MYFQLLHFTCMLTAWWISANRWYIRAMNRCMQHAKTQLFSKSRPNKMLSSQQISTIRLVHYVVLPLWQPLTATYRRLSHSQGQSQISVKDFYDITGCIQVFNPVIIIFKCIKFQLTANLAWKILINMKINFDFDKLCLHFWEQCLSKRL